MSIVYEKYVVAYPAETNNDQDQVNGSVADTAEPSLEKVSMAVTLVLEWFLPAPAGENGHNPQQLRARWRLK